MLLGEEDNRVFDGARDVDSVDCLAGGFGFEHDRFFRCLGGDCAVVADFEVVYHRVVDGRVHDHLSAGLGRWGRGCICGVRDQCSVARVPWVPT
jgi:hypothetical protein